MFLKSFALVVLLLLSLYCCILNVHRKSKHLLVYDEDNSTDNWIKWCFLFESDSYWSIVWWRSELCICKQIFSKQWAAAFLQKSSFMKLRLFLFIEGRFFYDSFTFFWEDDETLCCTSWQLTVYRCIEQNSIWCPWQVTTRSTKCCNSVDINYAMRITWWNGRKWRRTEGRTPLWSRRVLLRI